MNTSCTALTIAGSDPGGGAGIQADLKTFASLEVYGTSVITAVTAQNLTHYVDTHPVPPGFVKKQLLAILDYSTGGFPVKAIKTGMLFSPEIIESIAEILESYPHIPLVIDPVLISTTGSALLKKKALGLLKNKLFPLAALITPNIPEAESLCDIANGDQQEMAGLLFEKFNVPFLVKGGHLDGKPSDL
ncbi:MAG: hydroxymethylpyrimidine/phosphomethylpyrimidine kinase, partial [bacterium]|nr:hydroxymethylpyrimidine/phosphomethylpyrimidine kinase [bacterium]